MEYLIFKIQNRGKISSIMNVRLSSDFLRSTLLRSRPQRLRTQLP
jgi:hypothetical protein